MHAGFDMLTVHVAVFGCTGGHVPVPVVLRMTSDQALVKMKCGHSQRCTCTYTGYTGAPKGLLGRARL
jgi:pyruvate/2-oxoglutarate/acetoin dehydrogenase E1 component